LDTDDLQAIEQMLRHVRSQNLLRHVPTVVAHLVDRELPALLTHARVSLGAAGAGNLPGAGQGPGAQGSAGHGHPPPGQRLAEASGAGERR